MQTSYVTTLCLSCLICKVKRMMPTVTGFFSKLNKIIREHQEALLINGSYYYLLLLRIFIVRINSALFGDEDQVPRGAWAALGSQRNPGFRVF